MPSQAFESAACCCGDPADCGVKECGYRVAFAEAQRHYQAVYGPGSVTDAASYETPKMDASAARKATPIYSGVCKYFPLALAAVARVSKAGNDKHNPGEPLHWARGKSTDQGDALVRHQIDADGVTVDPDTGELHEASVAWRALAQLQIAEEKRLGIYKEI